MNLLLIFIFFITYSQEINLCSLRGYNAGCEMIGEGLYEALSKNFKLHSMHNRNHSTINNKDCKITIFADMLWYKDIDLYKKCPNTYIKIAYTMFEGSVLPKQWVHVLNNYFDAAIVPSDYLINLYKTNGVKIPIFLIPMAMPDLDKFEPKNNYHQMFNFGIISGLDERKGIKEAIKAFALKFGNNPKYQLLIHSYWASNSDALTKITNLIKKINCYNIKFSYGQLDRKEIINFYNNLHCLLACSAGEGFSLTPRESLKCKIPVICLDYGVQKNICDSGYVYRLPPNKKIPCFIESYGGYCGEIEIADAKNIYHAMQEIIDNYDFYKLLAKNSQNWLQQFTISSAAEDFKKLLSPKKIYLKDKNFLVKDGFITNCKKLAKKFSAIMPKVEIIEFDKN
jgi:glycosyltransferase involved in cell wall biosynthesis